MPEANQYMFKYQEVLEALVKKADLHEGKWQLIMSFGLAAANMGPNDSEVVPGAAIAVTSIGLQKAAAESPVALTVDAAVVNPASTASQRPASQSEPASQTKA
jgi:hypothetical protein